MFEEEAEEWVKENMDCCRSENSTGKDIPYFDEEERCCAKSAFQDGAEFGYNKAYEEIKQNGLALQSDMDKTIEQNIALKKELEKANEWHYVKDGDLPKISKTCLVYLANGDVITARLREDNVWTTNGHNAFENVTAWKEIVLPKESE